LAAVREVTKNWKMPAREWHAAKAQFALLFADRFELNHNQPARVTQNS